MSKIAKWVFGGIVILCAIFLVFYIFKGCGKGSSIQIIQDSLNSYKEKNDSIKGRATVIAKSNDSLITAKVIGDSLYKHKIDSQSHVISILKGQTKITKDSVVILYKQLKEFYDNKDTVALLAAYTELKNQWTELNQQNFNLQIAQDSIGNIKDAEIARLNVVIIELGKQIDQFKTLLTLSTDNASAQAKAANKAVKRAKLADLWAKLGTGIAGVLAFLLIAHK